MPGDRLLDVRLADQYELIARLKVTAAHLDRITELTQHDAGLADAILGIAVEVADAVAKAEAEEAARALLGAVPHG